MAKNLSEELAARNSSVSGFFTKFSAVSLRTLNLDMNNSSGGGGDGEGQGAGLEVSNGVVWTLVAPLIFLGALVVIGVTIACLWRLRDRR